MGKYLVVDFEQRVIEGRNELDDDLRVAVMGGELNIFRAGKTGHIEELEVDEIDEEDDEGEPTGETELNDTWREV